MSATYPDECRAPPLKKQLDDTRKAKLKQVGHVKSAPGYDPVFFPRDVIEEVLSRDKVEFVLSCPCNWCEKDEGSIFRHFNCGKRIDYIDFVTNRALRLFALLVYVGLPALIVGFLRTADAILDEDLDMERLKKTHLKGFERINSVPLTAFTGLLDLFLIHRHEFSPPVLEGGWSEQWDPKKALPFINTRFVGKGGYGTVYSFQIYPGYEKFKFEVSTGFAMKEVGLPAQSGSMNAEAETLTKIREELGDEKHIIKVLKIFRRGDKLHFIFPLARGNLEKFMEEPWKHQPNTCDSICQNTIWDEAVGMLKALAKFHRPPGMTSWRGYHADIKPTNILVFDDGTMVITDFGQALIAQKRSSEKTRRILQRPGEQAYRPPENSKESFMGPEYDDWAMGCVLLEILVFAIKGPRGVWELKNARQKTQYPTDYYYQVRDDQRFIHPEVEELLGGLASEVASWSVDVKFTVAALEIVKSMLRINHKTRMDSGEAASQLREKLNYWRNQANRGRRTSSNRSGPACPETSWPPNADQRLSKQL
ncbi:kinase-like domain-containing protein [Tricharina praecox]|uniref:kinase-like domain-containing protein n=1 Tax=Tricharina praecox TaxID=43433 RepID=UPI00221F8332|nr:kinase-like domain-containing protein [Tricharina praecox]KAI5844336.1 kinase-like domain-containing protein [Tricharina praecox]